MADLVFTDTNLLLYAVDKTNPVKQARATLWLDSLWQSGSGRLSWQVLNEFYVNAVRKMGAPPDVARQRVELFSNWRPVDISLGLAQRAWAWADASQVSHWDSLIVAAAERAGCRWLLSEDFQDGRKFGGVTVVNPFTRLPGEL